MIDALPALDRTSPTFRTEVDTFFGTQLPLFSVQAEAARLEINTNTLAAASSAADAASSAVTAAAAADSAAAAANFKGLWPDLTGALNKPASVKHNGRFWYLLNNLPNVALSEPSNSNPDWTAASTGAAITAVVADGATVAMVVGVTYLIRGASCNLSFPTMVKGDFVGVELCAPQTVTQIIAFGTLPFRGSVLGDMFPGAFGFSWKFTYEDATIGVF